MDPKQTIKNNLERRSKSVDVVELYNNVPKPTWVELSLIDVCNGNVFFARKLMRILLQTPINRCQE